LYFVNVHVKVRGLNGWVLSKYGIIILMNKVNILLTEANGNLSNEKEMIENAIINGRRICISKT
jgi:hypothetical protein